MSVLTPGLRLACFADLADPSATPILAEIGDVRVPVIVTRVGERGAAFRNKCPHAGYPLQRADGRILVQEGRYMVCGAHGASFALEDGACAGGPCNGDALERIPVEVRDGFICVL